VLAAEGVGHLLVDEATLAAAGAGTDRVWRAGSVGVVGRDLDLTDRVWSARTGFPRGADYRDFHSLDHPSGFRPSRVTDPQRRHKLRYDPQAAAERARRDAACFVSAVRDRLSRRRAAGERPLAVVAWDTELFGHWWHEGPWFLEHALRMLPEAGVRLATLARVVSEQHEESRQVDLPTGSWGAGKDLRLWAGDPVADLARDARGVAGRLLQVVRRCAPPGAPRDRELDTLAREALLALSSDWAFMVSRDSAAGYARDRHRAHTDRFHLMADRLLTGDGRGRNPDEAAGNVVVPHLDARLVP
jgi:1,4-alpha-glucan branching enzyme